MRCARPEPSSPPNILTAYLVAICLLVLSALPAAALPFTDGVLATSPFEWQLDGDSRIAVSPRDLGSEATVRTIVRSPDAMDAIDTFYLAGMKTGVEHGADALSVEWVIDGSGWWGPLWSLQLRSDTGLLAVGTRGGRDDVDTPGEPSAMKLADAMPLPGHVYESALSYDASTGAVSIAVTDLTTGEPVYLGGTRAASHDGALFGFTGVTAAHTVNFGVDAFEVRSHYIPVGTQWVTGVIADSGATLSSRQFAVDETLVVSVAGPLTEPPGTFHLTYENDDRAQSLAQFAVAGDEHRVTVPAAHLPLGSGTIRLEYVENGEVLLSEARPVTVGQARFRLSEIEVNRATQQITGLVEMSASTPLGVELSVQAAIDGMVWDPSARTYRLHPYQTADIFVDTPVEVAADGRVSLPFALTVPDRPGMWEISFRPSVSPAITLTTEKTRHIFGTYAPADPQPGEPFTIAVLPDTQYYAQSYPEIFLRQLQWIAEGAQDRNTLLTLHLGDITQSNIPGEWERAASSIGLLDGVMPYVLALGNHDMPAYPGSGPVDRVSTRINTYFPLESMPWLDGTFEPGRVENSFATFRLQDDDILVVSIEYGPRDEVLAWANEVIAAHPDHQTIVITHSYTTQHGGRSNSARNAILEHNPETTANGGGDIWSKVVSHHANVLMVLSGHVGSTAIPHQVAVGRHGNYVYEMLMDYQNDANGGNGHLVMMEFRPDQTIEVQAYSPYLDQPREEVDSRFGFTNHFIIHVTEGWFQNQCAARSADDLPTRCMGATSNGR